MMGAGSGIWVLLTFSSAVMCGDPATRTVLPQGILTGIRIQTQRRVIITGYLGIPYALPPLGPYRFAAPERHPGWNDSLVAENFRPDCLQPRANGELRTTSEDCLYLNVFVPAGSGSFNQFPVVVFVEGNDFVTGSPRIVEAQELASEGVIVVTLSYRLNVFGFLCLGDPNSRGNMGLLDQYLALLWVRENTPHFGGTDDITLMGHGAGASAVVTHMASPRTKGLFTRAIIMSGSVFSPTYQSDMAEVASRSIARSLGCSGDPFRPQDTITTLTCLRQKPADDVLKAFENVHRNGNWTSQLVPLSDKFLPERMQYLPLSATEALQSGQVMQIPVLTGISANEGTLLLDRWQELRRQPDENLLNFINRTAIPNMLTARGLSVQLLAPLLEWRYLHSIPGPRLVQLIQLYTEAIYSAPHWQQLLHLSQSTMPVFAYRFSQFRGEGDVTPGGHGSQLLFLFGLLKGEGSQWQAQSRSSPSFPEERLSLRMKRLWTTFMRTGDPDPSPSNDSRMWPIFHTESSVLELFSDVATGRTMDLPTYNPEKSAAALWNHLLPSLDKHLTSSSQQKPTTDVFVNPGDCGPYKSAMFTALSFLVLLIAALILSLVLLKRHLSSGRQLTKL